MLADGPSSSIRASTNRESSPPQQGVLLAIDDDRALLDTIRRLLIRQGWVVLTASDPAVGLEFYQEHWRTISLVLLDYYMPGMRGDQVWTHLHQTNPQVRVLWMTASDDCIPPEMRNSGLNGLVQKPVTRLDLLQGIREVLNHHDQAGRSTAE